ncbi:hypothetical protein B0J14DRAFT_658165 [Halenospora varia]|nr:hypothetical protein B0J14DRAFT_658165 [Halenospora varia]
MDSEIDVEKRGQLPSPPDLSKTATPDKMPPLTQIESEEAFDDAFDDGCTPRTLENWALELHRNNLVETITNTRPVVSLMQRIFKGNPNSSVQAEDRGFRINFAELQRMYHRQLQCKLIASTVKLRFGDDPAQGWEDDLHKYVQALQDYEYMVQRSQLPDDPFIATAVRKEDQKILRTAMTGYEAKLTEYDRIHALPTGPWEKVEKAIGNTRHVGVRSLWLLSFWNRLTMAIIAGAFLIAPMWIMVLKKDIWIDLKTTTAFVATFGVLMALFLDKRMDVLGSTAAYAAVLVVFVGAISTDPTRNP